MLVVFAAQHYARDLVLPMSQRRGSVLPRSRNDAARKAFERVTRSVLPSTHVELRRALEREAREFAKRQEQLRTAARESRGAPSDSDSHPDATTDSEGTSEPGECSQVRRGPGERVGERAEAGGLRQAPVARRRDRPRRRLKGVTRMRSRKPTDAERAERRQADRDRLEQAARALLSSEGWQRWVRIRSTNGLSRYSFGNQLLIAMQRPDATYVAGFRAFLELNRCVRKGERSIRILAPMTLGARERDASTAKPGDDAAPTRRTVFRAVSVFDVSQTDPLPGTEPIPLESPCQPIEGKSHAHLLPGLEDLAGELGYAARFESLDGSADGWCDTGKKEIVINGAISANAQVRVLVHEIAHALGVGYGEYGHRRAEVLVDTVTFIVCGSVGLDTSRSSVPYVAGWGETGELKAIRCIRRDDR